MAKVCRSVGGTEPEKGFAMRDLFITNEEGPALYPKLMYGVPVMCFRVTPDNFVHLGQLAESAATYASPWRSHKEFYDFFKNLRDEPGQFKSRRVSLVS